MTFERFHELALFWVRFATVIFGIVGLTAAFLQNHLLLYLSLGPLVLVVVFCFVMAFLCARRW